MNGTEAGGDIYRLYRPEWVTAYVVERADMNDCRQEVDNFFTARYVGRVRDEHVRYAYLTSSGADHATTVLQLLLPTVKGEFKYAHLAWEYARSRGWGEDTCQVVMRNSRDDHELRAYGVRKLASD